MDNIRNKKLDDLDKLEHHFKSFKIPKGDIKISPCSTIYDLNFYIKANFELARRYINKRLLFEPAWERLIEVKEFLSKNIV